MNPNGSNRVLFLSNGHGEDSIAASIAERLSSRTVADAYPLIGEGSAFAGICSVVGPRSFVPSQGWRHAKGSVLKDLPAMVRSIGPAVAFLRAAAPQYDKIVAIGDVVTPLLCKWAGINIDLYLDVFKTGQAHRYSGFEKWVLRDTCRHLFCRDDILARQLTDDGLDAVSHGNIMLDTVTRLDIDVPRPRAESLAVTLLPGSRRTTSEAFALQAATLRKVAGIASLTGYLALAEGISVQELAKPAGFSVEPSMNYPGAEAVLHSPEVEIVAYRRATGNLIDIADVVLSQSGTATQQALGAGKPVITFFAPDHRDKRMKDEQALMGEARLLVPPRVEALSDSLLGLLQDSKLRQSLGAIGQQRLGTTGTLDAVLELIEGP